MDRQPVVSSNIVSVGYDAGAQTLEVEFQGGAVWQYMGVEPETHAELMAAPSIGSHFHRHIKAIGTYLAWRMPNEGSTPVTLNQPPRMDRVPAPREFDGRRLSERGNETAATGSGRTVDEGGVG